MTARQALQQLTVPELLETLAALGTAGQVPAHLAEPDAVLHLSHGLVGAAERKAMAAELALRANGADSSTAPAPSYSSRKAQSIPP
ncbi:MAG: hypothetical protein ACRDQY_14135 [Pseudonocardiaceae bacterium]